MRKYLTHPVNKRLVDLTEIQISSQCWFAGRINAKRNYRDTRDMLSLIDFRRIWVELILRVEGHVAIA